MVKNPPVAATNAIHPIDNHEKNERRVKPEPSSAWPNAAGGGLEGDMVAVFLFFASGISSKTLFEVY